MTVKELWESRFKVYRSASESNRWNVACDLWDRIRAAGKKAEDPEHLIFGRDIFLAREFREMYPSKR